MDSLLALQLLAENSWGATRQILYDVKAELQALRNAIIEADEAIALAEKSKLNDQELARFDELVGRTQATAQVTAEKKGG